ncbi:MAG: hypothetical protein J7L66_02830, partial [Anaerolineaceae bacterium]|nr:hypothetical protein [Anaerolineaceae bacterium]
MFRSIPIIDRFFQFFSLPDCYLKAIRFEECKKSRVGIALDLLDLFFGYKTFPDNYIPCRLWEIPKNEWKFYYGSNYHPYQRAKLRRKVQPSEYQILFNDKGICEKLCRNIGVRLPHTYGTINPHTNYKEKIESWFRNSSAETLFIKPLSGRAGIGIVLAKIINNKIMIQDKNGFILLDDFDLMENAIVQELLKQDSRMAVFSSSSVNTIRVLTMITNNRSIIFISAVMRCGIGESYVDNISAGGIAAGIECETGKLNKYAYDMKGNSHIKHPISKIMFKDFIIPEWERILEAAARVQNSFPFYRLLGLDIALSE